MNKMRMICTVFAFSCFLASYACADDMSWKQLHEKATILNTHGEWDKACRTANLAARKAHKELGPNNFNTAQCYEVLASSWAARGQLSQAMRYYKWAMKIRTSVSGPNHPNVLACLVAMADLYRIHGKVEKAEKLYRTVRQRAADGGSLGTMHEVPAIEGLAQIARNQGDLNEAERLYLEALKICELTSDPTRSSDANLARTLFCLAEINKSKDNYVQAAELYKRALKKYTTSGPELAMLGRVHSSLGEMYSRWNKQARAIRHYEKALAMYASTGLPECPLVGATLIGLGSLYRGQKRLAEADNCFRRAVSIFQRTGGLDKGMASRILRSAPIWSKL